MRHRGWTRLWGAILALAVLLSAFFLGVGLLLPEPPMPPGPDWDATAAQKTFAVFLIASVGLAILSVFALVKGPGGK